jgi:hypothetical protein
LQTVLRALEHRDVVRDMFAAGVATFRSEAGARMRMSISFRVRIPFMRRAWTLKPKIKESDALVDRGSPLRGDGT